METLPESFDERVLTVTEQGVRLVAARCEACRALTFPVNSPECPVCGGTTSKEHLPETGRLHSFTELFRPLTIYPVPSTFLQVAFEENVLVPGRLLEGTPIIGAPCRIAAQVLGEAADPFTGFGWIVEEEEPRA